MAYMLYCSQYMNCELLSSDDALFCVTNESCCRYCCCFNLAQPYKQRPIYVYWSIQDATVFNIQCFYFLLINLMVARLCGKKVYVSPHRWEGAPHYAIYLQDSLLLSEKFQRILFCITFWASQQVSKNKITFFVEYYFLNNVCLPLKFVF